MARGGSGGELRDDVQRIARRNRPQRQIPEDGIGNFSRTCTVATQTIFVLIDGRIKDGYAVRGTDSGNPTLRHANGRRRREDSHLVGRMSVVAVRARGMPVVVQQNVLGSVVCIVTRRKRMSHLGKLGVDIWDRRVEIRTAVVASNAVLLIRPAQQAHRPLRVVWHMAGDTRVLRHRAIAAKVRLPGYFVGCLLYTSPSPRD